MKPLRALSAISPFSTSGHARPRKRFLSNATRDLSLRELGELFAKHLARLPPKPGLDPYTTMQIVNVRAAWAMDEAKDVIASTDGANWTVCLDRDVSLKQAVQSRTIFLTEVDSWQQVIPLLSPKVQTVGVAFGNRENTMKFAECRRASRSCPLRSSRADEQSRIALGRQAAYQPVGPLGDAEALIRGLFRA